MRLKPAALTEIDDGNDGIYNTTQENEDSIDKSDIFKTKSLEEAGHVDLFLPTCSLYVLSGVARYKYTHEILACGSTFQSQKKNDKEARPEKINVTREQRLSVIFRDEKRSF